MASIFDRISKRAAFPVTINGETIHVCEPTFGDIDRVRAMAPANPKPGESPDEEQFDGRTALSLALCLVLPDGTKAFAAEPGETDEQLARRVSVEIKQLTPSAMREIQDAIQTLVKPADPGELAKN